MELQDPKPTIWQLFRIWAGIGLQSFGGGASTTFLIQRAFIEKHKWLSMEEFLHLWNLCLLTPGINLVALTVLMVAALPTLFLAGMGLWIVFFRAVG